MAPARPLHTQVPCPGSQGGGSVCFCVFLSFVFSVSFSSMDLLELTQGMGPLPSNFQELAWEGLEEVSMGPEGQS